MASFISSLLSSKNSVINLGAEEFKQQLEKDDNAVLIDVRTNEENLDARIPNTKLINLMDPRFNEKIEKLDKSKNYYIYCRSGNRSYHAAKEMRRLGFEKVYNLASGIIGWTGEIERS